MSSQCKIAVLLTLVWFGNEIGTTVGPAIAADKTEPANATKREFDKASKDSLDLLKRDAAKPRPDVVITATADAAKWNFQVNWIVGKSLAIPKPTTPEPGRAVLLPPLSDIVVPLGKRVIVDVTSTSDIQPFVVPGLAMDTVAMPGRLQRVDIVTRNSGYFPSACADPCSIQARHMEFGIHVVDLEVFRQWYADKDAADAQAPKR